MGHKISKEQIDPGVKDHIMSFVGDVADLETEVNTDIISAVNSLMVDRVDNAENMGKLANAIGEPVTANHSVDEVVEGLGEMLSTFKTNMMNSGVMVESSDKFKQLIDKIKGLTEGEGNKGIQFAEGTWNAPGNITSQKWVTYNITSDMGFIPTYIFLYIPYLSTINEGTSFSNSTSQEFRMEDFLVSNINTSSEAPATISNYSHSMQFYFSNVSENGFVLNTYSRSAYAEPFTGTCKWYAIGVGEEDTTLRDSLANILEEEGVDVTEEDDMASLITKVDEEFDRKNANRGLNIISATELPNTGIENQICVITDSSVNQFVITPNNGYRPTDKIVLHTPDHNNSEYNYECTTSNVTYLLNITRIGLGNNTLASYYYSNGWQPLTYQYFPLMEDGMLANNAIGKDLATNYYFSFVTGTEPYAYLVDGGTGIVYTRTTMKIDFSIYNKITIRCRLSAAVSTKFWLGCYGDGVSNGAGDYSGSDFSVLCEYCTSSTISADTNEHVLSFDISSWSGTYYLGFGKTSNGAECHIYDILFYK